MNGPFLLCLTGLFNSILRSGTYPKSWSVGVITPIHKGGAKHHPACYRGITVLINGMGKIFATIIRTWLTEWAEDRGLFSEAQFGFRETEELLTVSLY